MYLSLLLWKGLSCHPSLMADMDLLVQPSIRESFGKTLVEAGYARLPVVAANVDGAAEAVADGETGILLTPTAPVEYQAARGASPLPAFVVNGRTRELTPPLGPDPQELAQAIISLLQNPERRREMGEAGYKRTRQLFSIERFVSQLEAVYRGDS